MQTYGGGKASEPTCHTNATAKETRRDYAIANAYLIPCVEGVRVHSSDEFPTHRPLQVKLATAKLAVPRRTLKKTDSAAKAIDELIAKRMEQSEEELTENKARKAIIATLHADMNEENDKRKYRMIDAAEKKGY